MKRRVLLEIFARHRGEAPTVFGPSAGGRMLYDVDHRAATLYNMELGYSAAVCLGLALAQPGEKVYALEGDGSMLMGLGVLTTVARYRPANLVIIVMDNRAYVTAGAMASATASGTDLAALGRGAGIEHVSRVNDATAFDAAIRGAATTPGPHMIVADVEPEDFSQLGSFKAMPFDIVESAIRFRRTLEDRGLVPPIYAI
jgi:sulfopyruvate decarboxylase subunit beta